LNFKLISSNYTSLGWGHWMAR